MRTVYMFRKHFKMRNIIVLILFITINLNLGIYGVPTRKYPEFGRGLRQEFFFEPDFIELNHGSYGPYSKVVAKSFLDNQIRAEKNADLWLRREAKTELAKVRTLLGKLINAPPEDIVLVPSTTSGMNGILRSTIFKPGERILHTSMLFIANKKLVQFICDFSKGAVSKLVFEPTWPMSNDELVQKFEKFLEENHDPQRPIRIGIVEHIPCVPSVKLPIERMIPLLRKWNITVLIDGAHGVGQVPIDIKALDPDYYVSNGHKWLMTARGAALLYVNKKYQPTLHPAHINAGYRRPSDFQKEYYLAGTSTLDLSAYMTIPVALQFREDVGGEKAIMEHNHNLAWNGGNRMASLFGTRIMQEKDQLGGMVDVQLPVDNPQDPRLNVEWWVDEQLYNYPTTYTSVYYLNGQWWARLSAQIYNDLSDFEKAAENFLKICKMLNSSQNKTAER